MVRDVSQCLNTVALNDDHKVTLDCEEDVASIRLAIVLPEHRRKPLAYLVLRNHLPRFATALIRPGTQNHEEDDCADQTSKKECNDIAHKGLTIIG